MKRFGVETIVGLFVVIGFSCFAFLAIKLGSVDLLSSQLYKVKARFNSVSGLTLGAHVELAGVRVGSVENITVDTEMYEAVVELALEPHVQMPVDSIASIRTAGIIGDRFVKLTPGVDEEMLKDGGEIFDTESAISIEELVSKYIFEGQ